MGSAPSTTSPRSGFCLLGAFGVSATSVAAKNHQFFMHVLLSALPYTKRSCGTDICYTEVLRTECWPRQGSHFPKHKIAGRNSNCLFQPNPKYLTVTLLVKHPPWLHRHAGEQVSSGSRQLRQDQEVLEREYPQKKRPGREKVR